MAATQRERIAAFTESLSRCLVTPGFLDHFYELFMAASPEISEKFCDTDFEHQKRAMTTSLYVLIMALEKGEAAIEYLEQLAEKHSRRQLDIPAEMYDTWLDCLIRTVGSHDPRFTPTLEEIWRETMKFGIDFMRERY